MDQGITPGAVALVVDGFSTGEFYPAALRAKGLRPVHVSSGVERGSPGLADYVAEALEHMRHDYDGFVDEAGNIDALAARLAPMAPCCVLPGCEMGVEAAELLAQRLGLPGNDPATSRTRRDKLAMHQALATVGLPSLGSLNTIPRPAAPRARRMAAVSSCTKPSAGSNTYRLALPISSSVEMSSSRTTWPRRNAGPFSPPGTILVTSWQSTVPTACSTAIVFIDNSLVSRSENFVPA